ncbi:ankyrin repeat and BTB/POZ domain-containing protein 1 [Sarotherodon galilaeus]
MFKLNQAALLFIQLLVVWHVFADDHRAVLVSRGHSVMLSCNISKTNATLITWTNNRSVFQYSTVLNRTHSNFSFHRLKINHELKITPELPTKLIIFSAQPEDEGLYTCSITDLDGLHTITWNLTVSENPEELISSKYFTFILPSAIGFLLCGITLAVFCYRKMMMRTLNQDPVQDQFPPHSGEEAAHSQPQGGTAHCTNNKRSSQYMERLNLIYGHF